MDKVTQRRLYYLSLCKASKVMNDINSQLSGVTDKNKRKAIIKSREQDLKTKFADKLTQLSVYQGKVLMKLIYRQTGDNCWNNPGIQRQFQCIFLANHLPSCLGVTCARTMILMVQDKAMEMIVQDVEECMEWDEYIVRHVIQKTFY